MARGAAAVDAVDRDSGYEAGMDVAHRELGAGAYVELGEVVHPIQGGPGGHGGPARDHRLRVKPDDRRLAGRRLGMKPPHAWQAHRR